MPRIHSKRQSQSVRPHLHEGADSVLLPTAPKKKQRRPTTKDTAAAKERQDSSKQGVGVLTTATMDKQPQDHSTARILYWRKGIITPNAKKKQGARLYKSKRNRRTEQNIHRCIPVPDSCTAVS